MRVRRRDEGEGREAVEEDGTEGGGGREEEESGRGRETQVARCGKKRRCGQRACQKGRRERGHHEHIGKRGITEPYLPYLLPRYHGCHGPGRQRYQCALRNTGALYLLPADSKQNWPGQLGDGVLPPERDMKQLAQVLPSGTSSTF